MAANDKKTTKQTLERVKAWANQEFVRNTVNNLVNYYLKSETYTKAEVQQLLNAIKQFTYQVAPSLPTASAGTMNVIYLVPTEDPKTKNVKDEFITIDNGAGAATRYTWEQIGSTQIDLSGYYTSAQTDAAITAALNSALANYTTTTNLNTLLSGKVDKVSGKGLSTNDYTNEEKTKLGALPTEAELNNEFAISGVYDVSAKNPTAGPNNDGKFTLDYILDPNNVNTLIPSAFRKGGMSIKFVQSSDNKYVQYRLMHPLDNPSTAEAAFTNTNNWQGVINTINKSNDIPTSVAIYKFGKAIYNQKFALISVKVPVYTTDNKTLTLPSGTKITNSFVSITLNAAVSFSYQEAVAQAGQYNFYYLVYNSDNQEKTYIPVAVYPVLELGDSSVIIAIVNFTLNSLVQIFTDKYYINSELFSNIYPVNKLDDTLTNNIYPSLQETLLIYNLTGDSTDYVKLPFSLPANSTVKIEVVSFTGKSYATIFGKTNIDDSSYYQFGTISVGSSAEKQIDRIINYIKVYNEPKSEYIIKISNLGELYNKIIYDDKKIKSIFSNISYISTDLSDGYYILTGSKPSWGGESYYKYTILQVYKGDNITITTVGGSNARAWALTDSNNNILSRASDTSAKITASLAVEQDGFLYVHCKNDNLSQFSMLLERPIWNKKENIIAPLLYNQKIDLKKSGLRILDIGNSYTINSTQYLTNIIDAAGIATPDCSHYIAVRSSGSFKSWVDCYNNQDTESYSVSKNFGDTIAEVSAGTSQAGDGARFRTALQAGWDLVIIHQASSYANNYSLWDGNTNGGYLKELIQIIRSTNPSATIGFLLVHSYATTYVDNTERSSLLRWENIAESTKKLVQNYGVDFIIPYGTAVQNLRESSLNDGSDFSTDGTHLAEGIGMYVANCCYYQSVFAPHFNKSIVGNTWRKADFDESVTGVMNIDNTNAELAQSAALKATCDMYNIQELT